MMPRHDELGISEYLACVESRVSSGQRTRYIFQRSISAISAHRDNTLNIQFMTCREVFNKLKHIFCFGGCVQFFTEDDVPTAT